MIIQVTNVTCWRLTIRTLKHAAAFESAYSYLNFMGVSILTKYQNISNSPSENSIEIITTFSNSVNSTSKFTKAHELSLFFYYIFQENSYFNRDDLRASYSVAIKKGEEFAGRTFMTPDSSNSTPVGVAVGLTFNSDGKTFYHYFEKTNTVSYDVSPYMLLGIN